MLPVHSSPRLIQPWRPKPGVEIGTNNPVPEYIDLPPVGHYRELEVHRAFTVIKGDFLIDIQELKLIAHEFVGEQYDQKIDTFLENVKNPPDSFRDQMLPIYREVRYQIFQLLIKLRTALKNTNTVNHDDRGVHNREYVTAILHGCLGEIDLCPAAVHHHFSTAFMDMAVVCDGLDAVTYALRKELFTDFILSFLFQLKRSGAVNYPVEKEVHLHNSLYNLCCKFLTLDPVDDPLAPKSLGRNITRRFLSEVTFHVNPCSLIRFLADVWSQQLEATLEMEGVSAWLTNSVEAAEITADIVESLSSYVFKTINSLLKTAGDSSLSIWTLAETQPDGSFRFDRYKEKMLAFTANYFCGSNTSVFTTLSNSGTPKTYIGTIDHLYYWVFQCDHLLHTEQPCSFEPDNHTSLTLSHLASLDFSSWPDTICQALLTQAMDQTDDAETLASFLLAQDTVRQLEKVPYPIIDILSSQLEEKLLINDRLDKKQLCREICRCLTSSSKEVVTVKELRRFINTPLLEPLLSTLKGSGVDISQVTNGLNSWQIADFSEESLKKIITPKNCLRLFRQAAQLNQATTLSRLLLTGHCDQLTNLPNGENRRPLSIVARGGVVSGLNYLLQFESANVNLRDNSGLTALDYAVTYGHTECVRNLLRTPGIQANRKNGVGWLPLNSAAMHGHLECLKMLLKTDGADVNKKNLNGYTPLYLAARFGQHECVEELLRVEGIRINEKNNNKLTALHSAARFGRLQCVQHLLKAEGVDVNVKSKTECTPLHFATRYEQSECIKELLRRDDIDPNKTNNTGSTPLHLAAQYGSYKSLRELLKKQGIKINAKNSDGMTAMHYAASNGYSKCIRALLKKDGIKVNELDGSGWTPLNRAALYDNDICIRELLTATDIEPNKKNQCGHPSLCTAANHGHRKCIIELLKSDSIEVNAKSNEQWTPLIFAAKSGHHLCVRELLGVKEIDVNLSDHKGCPPLYYAALYGHNECIRELLSAEGIQPNKKNDLGWTPLSVAAKMGHHKCIQELLKADQTDVNEKNAHDWSALDHAVAHRHIECVRELVKAKGIDINRVNIEGWTPMKLAATNLSREAPNDCCQCKNQEPEQE